MKKYYHTQQPAQGTTLAYVTMALGTVQHHDILKIETK